MNTKNYTLGLDLGDRRSTYCLLDAAGKIEAEDAVATSRECFEALSARYPASVIAMETGTHSPWVSRLFEARSHKVYVANARKVRAISQSNTKSDQEDARMLARLARVDPALHSPVKHRSEDGQRALLQIKVREALVRSRVNLMNSVRFLLKSLGLPMPSGVKAGSFVKKVRAVLDTPTCALVEPLLKTLETLNERIDGCEAQLEKLAPNATRWPPGCSRCPESVRSPRCASWPRWKRPTASSTPAMSGPTSDWCPDATNRATPTSSCPSPRPATPRCDACWSTAPTTSWAPSGRRRTCEPPDSSSANAAASRPRNAR